MAFCRLPFVAVPFYRERQWRCAKATSAKPSNHGGPQKPPTEDTKAVGMSTQRRQN